MIVTVDTAVFNGSIASGGAQLELLSSHFNSFSGSLRLDNCIAFPPLINPHDHLIGNWFPRAGDTDLYPNSHIWVTDMKESQAVKERDRIWKNNLPMNFFDGNGKLLARLGIYKNIFSGVNAVQDHAPIQANGYYDMFPINVVRNYRQCHSLELENFWGGESPETEMRLTEGKVPFIIHLGEGLDDTTAREFGKLKEKGLLRHNTLIIHGIALTENEIKDCAEAGASICWCPFSNHFLIGETLNVEACLKHGVNLVLGTDSTLSGSVNLLEEMRFAHCIKPDIPVEDIYKMVTVNAAKALFLPEEYGTLKTDKTDSVLLINKCNDDPYTSLLAAKPEDIVLLLHKGKPLYGQADLLNRFDIDPDDYFFYEKSGTDFFVTGHPEKIMETIDNILGYKKILPYLPFQDN